MFLMNTDLSAETALPYSTRKLQEALSLRQRERESYSLRMFARYLEIHPSTLSAIIAGKRKLPPSYGPRVAKKLGLPPNETARFLKSLAPVSAESGNGPSSVGDADFEILLKENLHFKVMSEWEHYAVLSLMDTEDFDSSTAWIAKRLGITELRARECLRTLLECGLVKRDSNSELRKTHASVRTSEDVASVALRKGHKEALEMGVGKLEQIDVDLRDFSEITIAADMAKIEGAKKMIRRFRQELCRYLEDGRSSEVYQLCVQLYPLTRVRNAGEERK